MQTDARHIPRQRPLVLIPDGAYTVAGHEAPLHAPGAGERHPASRSPARRPALWARLFRSLPWVSAKFRPLFLVLGVISVTSVCAQSLPTPGPGWREGRLLGVRTDNSKVPIALFVNTTAKPPWDPGPDPGVWHQIAVQPLGIPADALSVMLTGILTISHGLFPETCNLTVSLRAPGDSLTAGNYIMQTIAALQSEGARSNASSMVPVKDGKFEVQWNRVSPIPGEWPEYCAYGINLSAQFYVREGPVVPVPAPAEWRFEGVVRQGSP